MLGYNKFRVAGVKAIADSVVASACVIEELDLECNPIGDEGVKYLLDKFIQRGTNVVHKLYMEGIAIGRKERWL